DSLLLQVGDFCADQRGIRDVVLNTHLRSAAGPATFTDAPLQIMGISARCMVSRIARHEPEAWGPIMATTFSRSTSRLAAVTDFVSSLSLLIWTSSIGRPFIPPEALICWTAICAPS